MKKVCNRVSLRLPVLEYWRSVTVHEYSRSCGGQPLSRNSYVGGAMYFFCVISCNFPTGFSAGWLVWSDASVWLHTTPQVHRANKKLGCNRLFHAILITRKFYKVNFGLYHSWQWHSVKFWSISDTVGHVMSMTLSIQCYQQLVMVAFSWQCWSLYNLSKNSKSKFWSKVKQSQQKYCYF